MKLANTNHPELVYDVIEFDESRQIMMMRDPDTEKSFNWFPGTTLKECKVVFTQFGYELVDDDA